MPQHAGSITTTPPLPGLTLVQQINLLAEAILTTYSGSTEPSTPFPYMLWFDTSTSRLKRRNGGNNAWVTVGSLSGTTWKLWNEGAEITAVGAALFAAASQAAGRAALGATSVGSAVFTAVDQAAARAAIGGGEWTTGDVKLTLKTSADTGWVMCNDGTIGNASSGGTTRANADTEALFTLLWNNVSNTHAPVSGGRGASAAADFAANKNIALTKVLGRALAIAGAGSGLTSRALGETLGAETHQLTTSEMPLHGHPFMMGETNLGSPNGAPARATTGITSHAAYTGTPSTTAGQQIGGSGGDQAHNNMQPTSFLNAMIKL